MQMSGISLNFGGPSPQLVTPKISSAAFYPSADSYVAAGVIYARVIYAIVIIVLILVLYASVKSYGVFTVTNLLVTLGIAASAGLFVYAPNVMDANLRAEWYSWQQILGKK